MSDEEFDDDDPAGLFKDIKNYNRCEDCNNKIRVGYEKCYRCYLKSRSEKEYEGFKIR